MKKNFIWILFLFLFCSLGLSRPLDTDDEVLEILVKQKAAWNQGNIEGFMEFYWNSEDLTFQSGANRIMGWDALIDRYKKNYSGENMGILDFTDIVVNILSEELVLVLGHWEVRQSDETAGGLFTLILQHKPEGWRIIHDHTSS
jgi:beta-aspartyl-peptidase (threonine type)